MKNKTFKKSISVFLSVLMILSSWVWVPGEHNHVSALTKTINLSALAAITNGSGARAENGHIVICSDGEAGNTTVGNAKLDISSLPNVVTKATMYLNTGNHNGTLVGGASVKVFLIDPSKCQATSVIQTVNNIANIYGSNYNAQQGVTNAYNYYGVSEGAALYTFSQSSTGQHQFDITAAVNRAKANGWDQLCLAFIMPAIYNDSNSNTWSDTHINSSGTYLYCEYDGAYGMSQASYSDNRTGYIQTHQKTDGTDYLDIYYPTEIYLDKSESLEDAGYKVYLSGHYGSNDSYRTLVFSSTWGGSYDRQNGVLKNQTMLQMFDNYTYYTSDEVSVYSGKENYSVDGTNWIVNFKGTESNGGVFSATVNLQGTPKANQIGKEATFDAGNNGAATPLVSYMQNKNWLGQWPSDGGAWMNAGDVTGVVKIKVTLYDKAELNTYLNLYGNVPYVEGQYTPASWSRYQTAVAAAKATLSNRKVNQSKINTDKDELKAAYDELTLRKHDLTYENMFSFSNWYYSSSSVVANSARGTATVDINAGTILVQATANDHYTNNNYSADHYSIKVSPNTSYTLSWNQAVENGTTQVGVFQWTSTGASSDDGDGNNHTIVGQSPLTFTTGANTQYITFRFGTAGDTAKTTFSKIAFYPTSREADAGVSEWHSSVHSTPFTFGTPLKAPTVPTRTGYTFKEWYWDKNSNGLVDEGEIASANSLTTYISQNVPGNAHYNLLSTWTINRYDVTFSFANGSSDTQTYDHGTVITVPSNATKAPDATNHYTYTWTPAVSTTVTGNATYTEVLKAEAHQWGDWTTALAGDCITSGIRRRSCTVCSYVQEENTGIDNTVHNDVTTVAQTDATCTKDGYTAGEWCYDCNTWVSGHDLIPAAHTPGADATCTAPQTCTVCGEELAAQLAHTERIIPAVAATCTSTGLTEGKDCSVCGTVLVEQTTVPKASHSFTDKTDKSAKVSDATCTTGSIYKVGCANCDAVSEDLTWEDTDALDHSFTNYVSNGNATCTADGTKTAKCNRCDVTETITDEGSALGHSFTNYVSNGNATCTADGTKTAKCDRCDVTNTITDEGSMLKHTWVSTAVEAELESFNKKSDADCDSKAVYYMNCATCSQSAELIDATQTFEFGSVRAHDWSSWSADGEVTLENKDTATHSRYCQYDDCVATEETAHRWSYEETTAPSYTQEGEGIYTCTECSASVKETIPAIEDAINPVVSIKWGETTWNSILNTITFGTYVNYDIVLEISASDAETGVKTIEYLVSNEAIEDITAATGWLTYDAANTLTISKADENDYVVYAKVTDKAGNVSYAGTDGFVIDTTAPVITVVGAGNGSEYCGNVTVKAEDKLNVTATLDGLNVPVGSGILVNSTGEHTVVITDDAGNVSTVTFTVNADHTWDDGVVTTAPTCTADGEEKFTCEVCGDTRTETVDALGHLAASTYVVTDKADCTSDGTKTAYCGRVNGDATCNEVVGTQTIPARNHDMSDWEEVTAPTCTADGLNRKTCKNTEATDEYEACTHVEEETVSALGHNYNGAVVSGANRTHSFKCERFDKCGTTGVGTTAGETASCADNCTSEVTAPTCTAGGYTTYTCNDCLYTWTGAETEQLGHSFTNYVSNGNATCTADGTKTAKCDRCDATDTVTDTGSMLAHSFTDKTDKSEKVSAATCTTGSIYKVGCADCDAVSDDLTWEDTDILAHSFTDKADKSAKVSDATCTTGSIYKVGCANCDAVSDDLTWEDTDVLAHNFTDKTDKSEKVSAATCTTGSIYKVGCADCDAVSDDLTWEDTDVLDHSFTNYVSDGNATCTADGTKTAKCNRCDVTETITDEGSALGHSFTNYVSNGNATCTADGTKTAKCNRCDVTETITDEGSALGHSFTNYVSDGNATCTADGTKTAKCDRCDVTNTVADEGSMLNHTWVSTAVEAELASFNKKSDADCDSKAVYYMNCATCSQSAELIDATQTFEFGSVRAHDWSSSTADGEVTLENKDTATHSRYCQYNCGAEESAKHNWSYEITKTPTYDEAGTGKYTCDICSATFEVTIDANADAINPTVSIKWGETTWNSILNTITFGTYVNYDIVLEISASDAETGVATIEYLVSNEAIDDITTATGWLTYDAANALTISKANENDYVVYAKVTDKAGNVSYAGTDGFVIDTTAPVITVVGAGNGSEYCGNVTVKAEDKLNVTATLDGLNVPVGSGILVNTTGEHTVVITDDAGNVSTVTFTVNADHTWDDGVVTTAPTCTADGEEKFTCEVCGDTRTETVDALGHLAPSKYVVTDKADCTSGGTKTAYCGRVNGDVTCNEVVGTQTIPARNHDMSDWEEVTAPTCTDDGLNRKTCKNTEATDEYEACTHVEEETVSALGHNYNGAVVSGANGTHSFKCERFDKCGTTGVGTTAGETASCADNCTSEVTAPTCTAGGYTTYTCNDCLYTWTGAETEQLGHSFTNYVSNGNATCTADGTKTAKCNRCDVTETITDEGSALGHSFTNYVSDGNATCTADGTKTAKCDRCDVTDTVTDEGSVRAHDWSSWTADGEVTLENKDTTTHTRECNYDDCDATETEAHEWTSEIKSQPTYEQAGIRTYTCTACSATVEEEISANEDINAPAVSIKWGETTWNSVLNTITFGTYVNYDIVLEISASDAETGVAKVEYLVFNTAIDDIRTATGWLTYDAANALTISKADENDYVVYAKVTDKSGNVSYASTNGFVLDATAPVITVVGAGNGSEYCGNVTVKAEDKLNVTATLDGLNVPVGSGILVNTTGEHTVVITDDAGNVSTVTFTVNADHTWDDGVVTTAPTCTADGEEKFTCEVCGDTRTETVDALGHLATSTYVVTDKADCTSDGTKTAYCGRVNGDATCNEVVGTQTIPARNHDMSDWEEVTAPTCTADGLNRKTCKNTEATDEYEACTHVEEETVSALGHNYNGAVVSGANRTHSFKCERFDKCGTTGVGTTAGETASCADSCTSEVTAPTCTAGGYTTYTCNDCLYTWTGAETEQLGHSFTNYVSNGNATCLANGTETAKCNRCDETHTREDDESALGHSFTNYVSNGNATCTADGTKTAKCNRCDVTETITDEGSALGHSFTNYVSDGNATCTADGTKTAKCDRCDVTNTVADEGSMLDHSMIIKAQSDGDCVTKGYIVYECEYGCGHETTTELGYGAAHVGDADALTRVTVTGKKAATCGEDGYTGDIYCECGVLLEEGTVIPAGGVAHKWTTTVVREATCIATGLAVSTCENCGAEEESVIPVNPDNHKNIVEGVNEAPTCTTPGYSGATVCKDCGSSAGAGTVIPAYGHSFSPWTIITMPSEDGKTPGYAERSCSRCGVKETRNDFYRDEVYYVIYHDHDGTRLTAPRYYIEGDYTIRPADPVKREDAKYTYEFIGWDHADYQLDCVTGQMAVIAQYKATEKTYKVTFCDANGKVIPVEGVAGKDILYSDIAKAYKGATPTKAATEDYTYEFVGWNIDCDYETGEATVTPEFRAVPIEKEKEESDGLFGWFIRWLRSILAKIGIII